MAQGRPRPLELRPGSHTPQAGRKLHCQLSRSSNAYCAAPPPGRPTHRLSEYVDFVICLGGDGVILHSSYLFKHSIPPVRRRQPSLQGGRGLPGLTPAHSQCLLSNARVLFLQQASWSLVHARARHEQQHPRRMHGRVTRVPCGRPARARLPPLYRCSPSTWGRWAS